ncbi:hypothetical protein JGU65_14395 [Bacillus sp. T_4]|nr:hypothetical protein [Bacillus sp. T_4]
MIRGQSDVLTEIDSCGTGSPDHLSYLFIFRWNCFRYVSFTFRTTG